MPLKVNVGGVWKDSPKDKQFVNVAGVWKPLKQIHVNVAGVWKPVLPTVLYTDDFTYGDIGELPWQYGDGYDINVQRIDTLGLPETGGRPPFAMQLEVAMGTFLADDLVQCYLPNLPGRTLTFKLFSQGPTLGQFIQAGGVWGIDCTDQWYAAGNEMLPLPQNGWQTISYTMPGNALSIGFYLYATLPVQIYIGELRVE